MTSEAQTIGNALLKTGTLVSFRLVKEEVLNAPADEAEFGLRLELKFVPDEDDDEEQDENSIAEDTTEWGAFGLTEYEEKDEFRLADFMERLSFVRGELHFDADYIRGRRVKTRLAVRSNGTVALETIGRGKAALRWLEQLKGKKLMQLVALAK